MDGACVSRVVEIVAAVYGVPAGEVRAPTRRTVRVANARQMAMYLVCVSAGLGMTRTGRLMGRDRTTVRHAVRIIEDSRDDPDADRRVSALEVLIAP